MSNEPTPERKKTKRISLHFARAVASRRNSLFGPNPEDLDWNRWFTDNSGGSFYLHVWHKDGETIHRVYCRCSDNPRLSLENGKLMWLIDKKP